MRVVHLSLYRDPDDRPAGALLDAWPTLRHHAPTIRRAGVDVTVVHAAGHDERATRDDVPFHFARDPGRVVRDLRPDILHAHGFLCLAGLAPIALRLGRRRTLVQDHGGRPPQGFRRWAWQRLLGPTTVAFTAAEQAGWIGPGPRLVTVPEASTTMTPGDRATARRATGITGDPALLWLGRLDENKDPLTVLEAVARASDRLRDVTLTMAWTSGSLEDAVRRRVREDGRLAGRVRLLGRLARGEVETWLRAADLLVQGSQREAAGYAVIEAMACGTPVLVTDIPAFRAVLGDLPGDRVRVRDPDAFTSALVARRWPHRDQVRAHFTATLAWDVLGARWRACYEQMVRA